MIVRILAGAALGLAFLTLTAGAEERGTGSRGSTLVETCNSGTGEEAIVACTQLIEAGQNLVDAYIGRGGLFYDQNDYDHALEDYEAALKIAPDNAIAYRGRGNVYFYRDDLDRAIADYSKAISLSPASGDYYNRANAFREMADYNRAIEDYNEALRLDPEYEDALVNRCMAYAEVDKLVHAIDDCTAAIRIKPDDSLAYVLRGAARAEQGGAEAAMADFDEAMRIAPDDAFVRLNHAIEDFYRGKSDDAEATLRGSAETSPNEPYTRLWLDIVLRRAGKPGEFADAAEKLDQTKWPGPVIKLTLGELTLAEVEEAAKFPNAETRYGQFCEAYFYSGQLKLFAGDKAAAKDDFGKAIKVCPHSYVERRAALRELALLE